MDIQERNLRKSSEKAIFSLVLKPVNTNISFKQYSEGREESTYREDYKKYDLFGSQLAK